MLNKISIYIYLHCIWICRSGTRVVSLSGRCLSSTLSLTWWWWISLAIVDWSIHNQIRVLQLSGKSTHYHVAAVGFREPPNKPAWLWETPYTAIPVFLSLLLLNTQLGQVSSYVEEVSTPTQAPTFRAKHPLCDICRGDWWRSGFHSLTPWLRIWRDIFLMESVFQCAYMTSMSRHGVLTMQDLHLQN